MSHVPEVHNVTIKVMRLQCPSLPLQPMLPIGSDLTFPHTCMKIPTTFESLYVGERLSCYINLANTSQEIAKEVSLKYAFG